MDDTLQTVAGLLRQAERVLFITGAGLSADSGLPTYRGVGGLYERETTEEGIPIEEALSGAMLLARPEITWKHLWQIGRACRGGRFNRGHEVIALIEQRKPGTWVLTQNVDGYHHAAGSRQLIELHGRAGHLYCLACARDLDAEEVLALFGDEPDLPPRCSACGGLIRPDVVLFGEMLPEPEVRQLYALADAGFDLVFSVGTSGAFPYVVEPIVAAHEAGVPTVEINPGRTSVSTMVDYRIESGGAAALDALWELVA